MRRLQALRSLAVWWTGWYWQLPEALGAGLWLWGVKEAANPPRSGKEGGRSCETALKKNGVTDVPQGLCFFSKPPTSPGDPAARESQGYRGSVKACSCDLS